MTKYFKEFGWQPFVLTTEEGSYPSEDESLLEEVGEEVEVFRTVPKEVFALYNWFTGKKGKGGSVGFIGMDQRDPFQKLAMYLRANYFIPDARKGWNKTAIPKALDLHAKEKFDAIITTGPPQSTHLIGLDLKKRTGVKWLVDLRDPWVNVYYNQAFPRTKKTIEKDQSLENEVLRSCDAVSVVSPGLKREFEDRSKRIEVVYNGYDVEDLNTPLVKNKGDFLVSYIGNFKPNQNVPVLWKAISEHCARDPKLKARLKIQLTGNIHSEIIRSMEEVGLADNIVLSPFVTHKEAVRQMRNSNLLLFIIPRTKGNEKILTGKLFEYLASETQLFSIGPEKGDAAEILKQCGRMEMIDYADLNSMKEKLFQKRINGVTKEYQKFTRKEQARVLVDLLH